MSIYTRWERLMILCTTRERTCTTEKCKECRWISKEDKKWANLEETENVENT